MDFNFSLSFWVSQIVYRKEKKKNLSSNKFVSVSHSTFSSISVFGIVEMQRGSFGIDADASSRILVLKAAGGVLGVVLSYSWGFTCP